jgi:hypothetical protein
MQLPFTTICSAEWDPLAMYMDQLHPIMLELRFWRCGYKYWSSCRLYPGLIQ